MRTTINRDQASYHMSTYEIMVYLHGIAFIEEVISKRDVRADKWHKSGNTVDKVLHKVYMEYDSLRSYVTNYITGTKFSPLAIAIGPYLLKNDSTAPFYVTEAR